MFIIRKRKFIKKHRESATTTAPIPMRSHKLHVPAGQRNSQYSKETARESAEKSKGGKKEKEGLTALPRPLHHRFSTFPHKEHALIALHSDQWFESPAQQLILLHLSMSLILLAQHNNNNNNWRNLWAKTEWGVNIRKIRRHKCWNSRRNNEK